MIYWQPIIPASGVPTTAHQLMAYGLIAIGLWLGLERTNLKPAQRRATWLVALQLYRVFGSWALVAGLHGALPELQAFPSGIGDVLTGLFAVPAAMAVATGTAQGRRAGIFWNIFGLADFADAITLGIIFSSVSSIGAGVYPDVLTPAFVVPSSILLHFLSLRQLCRRGKSRA